MKILEVTPEIHPFSKTGGLADVSGALPAQLAALGAEVHVVTPRHRSVQAFEPERLPIRLRLPIEGRTLEAGVARALLPGSEVPVSFIDIPKFFDRDELYGVPEGDYPDNAARFVALCRAALELMKAQHETPDVIHVHDWQAALVPVYVKTAYSLSLPAARTVLTIHNLAYQGLFAPADMGLTGLDWSLFNWRQLEYYGKLSFLKGGIVFADAITTVSPTYAREIQTPEYGCGFDGILRERAERIAGILNGADYRSWNPEQDPHLTARFSAKDVVGKAACAREVRRELGLPDRPRTLLIGFVGRLSEQKGIDILSTAMESLAGRDIQIAILGNGEARYHDLLRRMAERLPGTLAVRIAFDEALAHRIVAGADAMLVPSRYEPCGLIQMYALRYGTLPVVRRTGGLADTVVDASPENLKRGTATGFVFDDYSPEALVGAIERALAVWKEPRAWARIVRTAMRQEFSWRVSAEKYLRLFETLQRRPSE